MTAARYRVRRTLDFARLAESLRRPGMDTRVWAALARVDDDDDAVRWDAELGWLVDVTFVGGELDGDGPVVCRVGSPAAGVDVGRQRPPRRGCLVAVLIMGGDANIECVITGQLHDEECLPPSSVNGTEVSEQYALETHFHSTPDEDLDEHFRNVRTTAEENHRVLGQLVELAEQGASQSFVRGDDQQQALDSFLSSLSTWAGQVGTILEGIASAPASQAQFIAAITTLKTQLQQALSSRVKGE